MRSAVRSLWETKSGLGVVTPVTPMPRQRERASGRIDGAGFLQSRGSAGIVVVTRSQRFRFHGVTFLTPFNMVMLGFWIWIGGWLREDFQAGCRRRENHHRRHDDADSAAAISGGCVGTGRDRRPGIYFHFHRWFWHEHGTVHPRWPCRSSPLFMGPAWPFICGNGRKSIPALTI